jgi:anti-anti-sigma factor
MLKSPSFLSPQHQALLRTMPADDYTLRIDGDVLIVQIDVNNLLGVIEVNRIGRNLDELIKDPSQPSKVVLDLAKVRYTGSAALGMLLSLSKSLQTRDGRLVLCGTQHLEMLFKVSRTVAVFEISRDVNAAVQLMQK